MQLCLLFGSQAPPMKVGAFCLLSVLEQGLLAVAELGGVVGFQHHAWNGMTALAGV